MNERPIFFENRGGRRLFGVVHEAPGVKEPPLGVVFCHALDPEREDGYHALVEFSRRLASANIPSFRFDCYGFGDSEGEQVDATIESQLRDIRDAIDRFVGETGVSDIVMLGVRFGGTLAALTAAADERVSAVGLISPVVSGAAYWDERLRGVQLSRLSHSREARKRRDMLDELERLGSLEVDAALYSREFVAQLGAIDLVEQAGALSERSVRIALGADKSGDAAAVQLRESYSRHGLEVFVWPEIEREFWTSKSLYDHYLPSGLYERTIGWLGGLSR